MGLAGFAGVFGGLVGLAGVFGGCLLLREDNVIGVDVCELTRSRSLPS